MAKCTHLHARPSFFTPYPLRTMFLDLSPLYNHLWQNNESHRLDIVSGSGDSLTLEAWGHLCKLMMPMGRVMTSPKEGRWEQDAGGAAWTLGYLNTTCDTSHDMPFSSPQPTKWRTSPTNGTCTFRHFYCINIPITNIHISVIQVL